MGKLNRNARRQARKAKRSERREDLKVLLNAIQNAGSISIPEDDSSPNFISKFNEIWPILKPALKFAIKLRLTDEKADKVLEAVLTAGELVAKGGSAADQSAFQEKFRDAWDKIEIALEVIQLVTPANVDKVIDDVMEVGDWIAGE